MKYLSLFLLCTASLQVDLAKSHIERNMFQLKLVDSHSIDTYKMYKYVRYADPKELCVQLSFLIIFIYRNESIFICACFSVRGIDSWMPFPKWVTSQAC
jgi:hypothetical protein